MPYIIKKVGKQFAVENSMSGRLHGMTTKDKAEKQKRLLEYLMRKQGK
jgi:hypothetical protein